MREKLHKNRLLSFLGLATIWCLFVWITSLNGWFYFGIFIIADATSWNYVIWKKYKRPKVKKGVFAEWTDAIVFAVIAATIIRSFFIEAYTIPTPSMEKSLLVGDFLFVSKLSYGPRVPMTPVAFPFVHHTMPFGSGKSYLESVKIPYHRMSGFNTVKNNDVVVFNYPAGDTIITAYPEMDYYQLLLETAYSMGIEDESKGVRQNFDTYIALARKRILASNPIHVRPLDKKENYIKRCIGIAGDTLKIVNQQIFINGKEVDAPEGVQFTYNIKSKTKLNSKRLKDLDIAGTDIKYNDAFGNSKYTLKTSVAEELVKESYIESVEKECLPPNVRAELNIYPITDDFKWNRDNYGPIYIPKKGDKITLTKANLHIYSRAIRDYENNKLEIKGNDFYINDTKTTEYTFKQNYYFMMGDNRHNSLDSRFWGFVPEDHIVGKAVFIWMSWDTEGGNIFSKIRWSRLFNFIH